MANTGDIEHFDSYRDQTRVKHSILEKYLNVYFQILKKHSKNLVYIDAFAGRGFYENSEGRREDGSPIRALKIIASDNDLAAAVQTMFIEKEQALYGQLKSHVDSFFEKHPNIKEPSTYHGTFEDCISDLVEDFKQKEFSLAPTFLFVDPCGVAGVSLDAIRSVMKYDKCELFVFFNYTGVNRIAGLRNQAGRTLDVLLGSSAHKEKLCKLLDDANSPGDKEKVITSYYVRLLRNDLNLKYVVPFRIESERNKTTSHYLIHASKSSLAFRIMKDIMWPLGGDGEGKGGLSLIQASNSGQEPLFRPQWDEFKASVLGRLYDNPIQLKVIYENWPADENDYACRSAYRKAILELESEGKIQVLDKDRITLKPASRRPRHKGVATLGDKYYVVTTKNN